jgi:hypothetical protein
VNQKVAKISAQSQILLNGTQIASYNWQLRNRCAKRFRTRKVTRIMKNHWNRLTAIFTLAAVLATTLFVGTQPVQAKSSTWKKVAIGAAAVAGYGAVKGKKGLAIAGAAVAAGSYLKAKHDKKKEWNRTHRYRSSRYRSSRYRYSR